jgi:hypothetical protein
VTRFTDNVKNFFSEKLDKGTLQGTSRLIERTVEGQTDPNSFDSTAAAHGGEGPLA